MISFFWRGSAPLFLRIFSMMLLTVGLVQVLNFAIVLLTPPPQPRITTVEQVVALLKGRSQAADRLRVYAGAIGDQAPVNDRDLVMRHLLAQRLSLPDDGVRVRTRWPNLGPGGLSSILSSRSRLLMPGRGFLPERAPGSGMGGLPAFPHGFEPRGELILIGDFSVSAKIGGKWHTVESRGGGFAPWRLGALLWLAVATVVAAPIAWLLARRLARPIRLFGDAARQLGRNPRSQPLELTGPAEIREAAGAFNEMQARLNRYVEDRTTLMAAIAHDLRTPLMRLGLRLEHAPPDIRESAETDIREMQQMIAAVMAFVRDMNRPTRRQKLDLRSLAQSTTDWMADQGGTVVLQAGDAVVVEGDAAALKAMLSNLVSNAIKYGGNADVALAIEGDVAVVEVSDNGPGMALHDLDRAFEPFFRAERSRNRDTGGIGLGLASVRAVARAHGGEATLANRPEGGLVARVTLPL